MFQKQPMMRKVLYALAPIGVYSIYLYGWRSLAIMAISVLAGVLTEYYYLRRTSPKKKVSEAVLVSGVLYAMGMPPGIPLLMVPVGIILAVLLAKMAFGGFGRNLFNPAITGRLLMYLIFSNAMTSGWQEPGSFGLRTDGDSVATLLMQNAQSEESLGGLFEVSAGGSALWFDLLFGFRSGSIGEAPVFLLLLGAVYLLATKTASWRLMLAGLIGFIIPASIFGSQGESWGLNSTVDPFLALFVGSFLFVDIFMVTDPVSAPNKRPSLWLYGLVFGLVTVLVRYFAPSFPEGTSFGILVANVFGPWFDEWFPNATNAFGTSKKKKAPSKKIKIQTN